MERKSDETRRGKPFFYCVWLMKRPYIIFGITLGLHLLMLAITGVLYGVGIPVLPLEFRGMPYEKRGSDIFSRQLAWLGYDYRDIERFFPNLNLLHLTNVEKFILSYRDQDPKRFIEIIIEDENGNVLSKNNLQKLAKLEKELFNDSQHGYGSPYPPYSILRYFDGTLMDASYLFFDPKFERISSVLGEALKRNDTKYLLEPLIAKDSIINSTHAISTLTFISFYASHEITVREQSKQYWLEKFNRLTSEGYEGLEIYTHSLKYHIHLALSKVYSDMYLIIGSCAFIFTFMWLHTTSLWLSVWAIFSALFSFVTGNIIYSTIFGFKYFGIFNVLSIFIILGISADDVFILCDAWKSSAYRRYDTPSHRLSDCYCRAAKSMFVTSLTTAVAFFANSFSSILTISSFGAFSGVVILINYLSVIIFYPSVIVIYHRKFENLFCKEKNTTNADESSENRRVLVRFLSGPYFKLLTKRWFQFIAVVCVVGFSGACAFYSTTIRPKTREVQLLKKNTNVEKFFDLRLHAFKAVEPNSDDNVYIVWGIKRHVNKTRSCGYNEYRRECYWEWDTIYDTKFDLNSHDEQRDLLRFCQYLKDLSDESMDELKIRKNPVSGRREIYCFIDDIKQAVEATTNMSFPMTDEKVEIVYAEWKYALNPRFNYSSINGERYMEKLYRLWENNPLCDKRHYGGLIGIDHEKPPPQGERFAFVAVKVGLYLKQYLDDYYDVLALYDKWENLVTDQVSRMSVTMRKGFQTTEMTWSWFELIQTLVTHGVLSIALGIGLAWLILTITIGNWVVATMATIVIALVSLCVIGVIGILGWNYGILEAVNTSLVVSLAIDYVVHLGVAYHTAPQLGDRAERVKYVLSEVGFPVLSGAITTLGSSFFMLFAEIQFFFQFGIFMFCAIGFSILYSLTIFLVVLLLVGPQGCTGSNLAVLKSIKTWFVRSSNIYKTKSVKGNVTTVSLSNTQITFLEGRYLKY